jgi:hypothetical protein
VKKALVLAAAGLLTAASTGCAGSAAPKGTANPARRTSASASRFPMPVSTARHLPPGVFYLLADVSGSDSNIWEVTRAGVEKQISQGPPVQEFAISSKGIIAGAVTENGEVLTRVTAKGMVLVHPRPGSQQEIPAQAMDMNPRGQITYFVPPGYAGKHTYRIMLQPSVNKPPRVIFEQRSYTGVPLFGPHGKIAIIAPPGVLLKNQPKPGVLIINSSGHRHALKTGLTALGYPPLWGAHAPALEVATDKGPYTLYFPDGHREALPSGWRPETWTPDEKSILLLKGTTLGLWSLSSPGKVTAVGPVSKGLSIVEIYASKRQVPL